MKGGGFGFLGYIAVGVLGAVTGGFLFGWRYLKDEKLLALIVLMTAVLAVLQFGGVPNPVPNTLARIYAALCLLSPLLVLTTARRRRRPE
jgi:hypothetical protein